MHPQREYLCNMKNKNDRLEAIRLIISEQDIKNQDQVLPNHAILQKKSGSGSQEDSVMNQPRYGFVSLNFSGNMAVIKTKPGYASSLAYDVDNHNLPGVLGTIAGDDTLLIVLTEGANRQEIKRLLEPIIISL